MRVTDLYHALTVATLLKVPNVRVYEFPTEQFSESPLVAESKV